MSSDMYYRDPALFGKQSVVDRYIDQIALAFDIPRSCLNVVSSDPPPLASFARTLNHVRLLQLRGLLLELRAYVEEMVLDWTLRLPMRAVLLPMSRKSCR